MTLTRSMRAEYETQFETATVSPKFTSTADKVTASVVRSRSRYDAVASRTQVPWYVIAVIHQLECSGRFDCHLHNGDPLRRRTVNVPAGRPLTGKPPFTWEASAIDALTYDGFTTWSDWSVGGTLYKLERYNGFGYRKRGLPSPYLWSGSQHYTRGKYVADGHFEPSAVSAQLGAAVALKAMRNAALIDFGAKRAEVIAPSPAVSTRGADHDCINVH